MTAEILLVTELYDFSTAGIGKYSFAPITDFQVAGAEDAVSSVADLVKVTASSEALEIEVTGDVARRVRKRSTNICEDSTQAAFIDARCDISENVLNTSC